MNEVWQSISESDGWYEVSNLGRVRRVQSSAGAVAGRVLKWTISNKGYPYVDLSVKGVRFRRCIHVLVAAAFLGPCPEGHEVGHTDNDRKNPRADNLNYVTHKQNMEHAVACDRAIRGTKQHLARLRDEDIPAIRQATEGVCALARRYGVTKGTITFIRQGKTWKHVPWEAAG